MAVTSSSLGQDTEKKFLCVPIFDFKLYLRLMIYTFDKLKNELKILLLKKGK